MSPSAFWCQLLAFPPLRSWNQQALLKAQLLPGKDFISLCTSYPFRDRCHHGTIVGDHPVPVPSSAQLLQNVSTCSMANQRGVSSCISFAFSCSTHTSASPDNTVIRDPRGVEKPSLYTREARAGSAFISPDMSRAPWQMEEWLENQPKSTSPHPWSRSLDLLCTWREGGLQAGCVN